MTGQLEKPPTSFIPTFSLTKATRVVHSVSIATRLEMQGNGIIMPMFEGNGAFVLVWCAPVRIVVVKELLFRQTQLLCKLS